ncbi:MAG: starch-binding protein, partial [Ruminococcus sp.]|nr:starch-binding protein [Ruminococcus sp.]
TPADDTITVYFTDARGWGKAYIYAFNGVEGESSDSEPFGTYPGAEMNYVKTNSYGQDIYSYEISEEVDYIKFSNGSADGTNRRTDNVPKDQIADNAGFYPDEEYQSNKWTVGTYTFEDETPEETEPTATETTPVSTDDETTPVETEPTETTAAETEPTETTVAETEPTETTVAETEPTETEPVDTTIKVYAINSVKWASVSAYYWGGAAGTVSWPGKAMTKTAEKVNGFDVYEFTFDAAPDNIIFNNNNNGSQTADLTFEAGKYFDIKSAKWYDSLDDVPAVSAVATDRYLAGSFNNWSTTATEFKLKAEGEKIAYVELELAANTTYEFKIVREGTWTSCKDTLSITNTVSGLTFSSSIQGNTKITTKAAGTYVFAFGMDDSKLSVTYPG